MLARHKPQSHWHSRGGIEQVDVLPIGTFLVHANGNKPFARQRCARNQRRPQNSHSKFGQKDHGLLLVRSPLFVRAVRIDPNADVLIPSRHSHESHVAYTLQRLDRGLDVDLIFIGVGSERLRHFPGNGDVHVLFTLLVHHMNDQLPVFFGDAHIVVLLLDGHEFAIRGRFYRIQNHFYVHVVGLEITDLNFAVTQLTFVDRWNDLLRQRKRQIHSDQFVGAWVRHSHVQIALRGHGPNGSCCQEQGQDQDELRVSHSFHPFRSGSALEYGRVSGFTGSYEAPQRKVP